MADSRSRRLPLAVTATALSAGALALVAPAMASAAVTIGANLSNTPHSQNTCSGPTPGTTASCDLVPLSEGNVNQVAPTDGVITRWRVVGGSGPMKLRVVRPQADGSYLFVSSSPLETPATTGLETFNTRQAVQAGDYIGLELESASATLGVDQENQAPLGTSAAPFAGPIADGATGKPEMVAQQARGYLNADVEPDADHDGFGDETQDQCPTNATVQGPCPPPVVVDKAPPSVKRFGRLARLSHSGSMAFFLLSNEQASGTATATVNVPKSARVVRFTRHVLHLKAGKKTKVTLRLSKHNAALVRRALKKHRKLTAKVTILLKDSAGNKTTRRFSITLK
jgi:hypothetical protein